MKRLQTTQDVFGILAILENKEEKHMGLSSIQSQISFKISLTFYLICHLWAQAVSVGFFAGIPLVVANTECLNTDIDFG